MEGLAKEAFSFTGPFPIIQAAVLLIVIYGIYAAATRGQRDSGAKPEPVPQWLMMGPLHDMMQSVHEVAEQGRQQTDLLRRIEGQLGDLLRQTEIAKATLEAIRNESRLR